MGHRKHSAPRRGSLAFRPRGRFTGLVPTFRMWFSRPDSSDPSILGFAGFKAGMIHMVSSGETKTAGYSKPRMKPSTVLAVPPITLLGIRAYIRDGSLLKPLYDIYAKELPKELARKVRIKPSGEISKIRNLIDRIVKLTALVSVVPKDAKLQQKKPFLFEVGVGGGDTKSQLDYLESRLGKKIKVSEVMRPGMYVDVAGVTKGKGFEGPVTRFGIKRKQHKSRKSVRAVGTLGAWNPHSVMYTVPRAGQHGNHKRVEYNKQILVMGDDSQTNIAPKSGFVHFGDLKGDYMVLSGSIPGPSRSLSLLRYPARSTLEKIQTPEISYVSTKLAT